MAEGGLITQSLKRGEAAAVSKDSPSLDAARANRLGARSRQPVLEQRRGLLPLSGRFRLRPGRDLKEREARASPRPRG